VRRKVGSWLTPERGVFENLLRYPSRINERRGEIQLKRVFTPSAPARYRRTRLAVDSLTALVVVLDSEGGVAGDVTNDRAVSQTPRTQTGAPRGHRTLLSTGLEISRRKASTDTQ
jgi:hypothetical protein